MFIFIPVRESKPQYFSFTVRFCAHLPFEPLASVSVVSYFSLVGLRKVEAVFVGLRLVSRRDRLTPVDFIQYSKSLMELATMEIFR